MSARPNPYFASRVFLAFLCVMFLGFLFLLLVPFDVPFGGTVATTYDLFESVDTQFHFVHDLFYLYTLRVPIEVFGYNSILTGFSAAFVFILLVDVVQWFLAGFLTRNHKANLVLWGVGVVLLFLTAWLGVRIPATNVPAYNAFVALETVTFSGEVWLPLLLFSGVALGSSALGTMMGMRRYKDALNCPTDVPAQCDPFID